MHTKISKRRMLVFVTLGVVLLITAAMVAFIPGLLLSVKIISTGMVSEMLFRLEGNAGIVWDALGPKGPGYADVQVTSYQGDVWKWPGIRIKFQVKIDTTDTPILCQGQVNFARGDPNYIAMDWQDERCAEQNRIVNLAHSALYENGVGYALPEQYMEKASRLLVHWINEGRIKLSTVREPKMHDLVKSQVSSYP
jgi:hypothetical protein